MYTDAPNGLLRAQHALRPLFDRPFLPKPRLTSKERGRPLKNRPSLPWHSGVKVSKILLVHTLSPNFLWTKMKMSSEQKSIFVPNLFSPKFSPILFSSRNFALYNFFQKVLGQSWVGVKNIIALPLDGLDRQHNMSMVL